MTLRTLQPRKSPPEPPIETESKWASLYFQIVPVFFYFGGLFNDALGIQASDDEPPAHLPYCQELKI